MVFYLSGQSEWQPWIVRGVSYGDVKYLVQPDVEGKGLEAGIWRGTSAELPAGTRVKYRRTEIIYVLSGSVVLEVEGGENHELRAGDAIAFRAGDIVRWTILSDVFEEFYVFVP